MASPQEPGTDPRCLRRYALARASQPGYLRFGGGGADTFAYEMPGGPPPYFNCSASPDTGRLGPGMVGKTRLVPASGKTRLVPASGLGKQPPHCLNTTWLLNFLEFADYSGAHLIFGLDINARSASGRWDPAPARALIQFATAHGHAFAGFELGPVDASCVLNRVLRAQPRSHCRTPTATRTATPALPHQHCRSQCHLPLAPSTCSRRV